MLEFTLSYNNSCYYMPSSASGQDKSNSALWLATQAGKMEPLARSGLPTVSRKKNFPKSHIINPLLTQFVRSRWLDIGLVLFFASLWTSTLSRSINTLKKDFANIQPSWPHTSSITHVYCIWAWCQMWFCPCVRVHKSLYKGPNNTQQLTNDS